MKKMFVAFGIAIAIFVAGFIGMSVQAQATEEPSVEEKLEAAFAEWIAEEDPDCEITKVDLMNLEKDYYYGNYKAMFTYELDGYAGFTAVSLNSLDC